MNLEADKLAQDMLSEAMSKPVVGEGGMEIGSYYLGGTLTLKGPVEDAETIVGPPTDESDGLPTLRAIAFNEGDAERIVSALNASVSRSPTPSPQESALREAADALHKAASEVSNHDRRTGYRRTQGHWSRLHNAIRSYRALSQGWEG